MASAVCRIPDSAHALRHELAVDFTAGKALHRSHSFGRGSARAQSVSVIDEPGERSADLLLCAGHAVDELAQPTPTALTFSGQHPAPGRHGTHCIAEGGTAGRVDHEVDSAPIDDNGCRRKRHPLDGDQPRWPQSCCGQALS